MNEKWYMFRHADGSEVKVIQNGKKDKAAIERKKELKAAGYKLMSTIDPVTVNKGAK
jgi:hypothetical protein